MIRHLVSYAMAAFLPVAMAAQPAPQVSAPASPPPTAAAPSQPALANILQDGTPIKLQLVNRLDSHTAKNEDEIRFEVVNDVVIGGITVLRRGAPATGVVTNAASAKTMGRAGRLSFAINDVKLGNGRPVPVRAFNRTSGENRTGEMIDLMLQAPMAAAPFFLLMHGTNTVFPRGTEITAFVNGDLRLDLASFAKPPSAETTGDELKAVLQISSTPDGAQVLIDGAAAGTTPLNVTMMAGKHEISIKKTGYSDWSKSVNTSGGTVHVDAALEAAAAQ